MFAFTNSKKRLGLAMLATTLITGCSAGLTPPGPVGNKGYYTTNARVQTASPTAQCEKGGPGARTVDGRTCPWPAR